MKDLLTTCRLFKNCDEKLLDRFVANAQSFNYPKGKMLFIHEEPAEQYYLICRGWVKLFRETIDGTQAVVDIMTKGSIFGETALFQDDVYPFSAEVVEEADLVSLSLKQLKNEIETNPVLAMNMMGSMARYRRQQEMEIEHRSIQNAPQRIGCFLLHLTEQQDAGSITFRLPYDKTLIASRLGMQPETFSRALAKLKETTDIEVKGAQVTIKDIKSLAQFSCQSCSNEFPCKSVKAAN